MADLLSDQKLKLSNGPEKELIPQSQICGGPCKFSNTSGIPYKVNGNYFKVTKGGRPLPCTRTLSGTYAMEREAIS
jgi:hypothetical protein